MTDSPYSHSFETSVRALAILVAAYPKPFDLERLIEMDHLVVHSVVPDGPDCLHAPLHIRATVLSDGPDVFEKGVKMMVLVKLVKRVPSKNGVSYVAAEDGPPFFHALTDAWSPKLGERAKWVVEQYGDMPMVDVRRARRQLFKE